MQKQIQQKKRQMKKRWNAFINRILFLSKMGIGLIVVFFIILFMLTKPIQSNLAELLSLSSETTISGSISKEEFIEQITPIAKQAQLDYGVRPSILVAQAALESNWGNSELSQQSNNFFGIKAGKSGEKYATKEFTQDEWRTVKASFKTYDSIRDSVNDYAKLIKNGTSWNGDLYLGVIEAGDYKEAAYALQKAGYATDPSYANKLIKMIEQYDLYELDY